MVNENDVFNRLSGLQGSGYLVKMFLLLRLMEEEHERNDKHPSYDMSKSFVENLSLYQGPRDVIIEEPLDVEKNRTLKDLLGLEQDPTYSLNNDLVEFQLTVNQRTRPLFFVLPSVFQGRVSHFDQNLTQDQGPAFLKKNPRLKTYLRERQTLDEGSAQRLVDLLPLLQDGKRRFTFKKVDGKWQYQKGGRTLFSTKVRDLLTASQLIEDLERHLESNWSTLVQYSDALKKASWLASVCKQDPILNERRTKILETIEAKQKLMFGDAISPAVSTPVEKKTASSEERFLSLMALLVKEDKRIAYKEDKGLYQLGGNAVLTAKKDREALEQIMKDLRENKDKIVPADIARLKRHPFLAEVCKNNPDLSIQFNECMTELELFLKQKSDFTKIVFNVLSDPNATVVLGLAPAREELVNGEFTQVLSNDTIFIRGETGDPIQDQETVKKLVEDLDLFQNEREEKDLVYLKDNIWFQGVLKTMPELEVKFQALVSRIEANLEAKKPKTPEVKESLPVAEKVLSERDHYEKAAIESFKDASEIDRKVIFTHLLACSRPFLENKKTQISDPDMLIYINMAIDLHSDKGATKAQSPVNVEQPMSDFQDTDIEGILQDFQNRLDAAPPDKKSEIIDEIEKNIENLKDSLQEYKDSLSEIFEHCDKVTEKIQSARESLDNTEVSPERPK